MNGMLLNTFDYVIIGITFLSIFFGLINGFLHTVFSLVRLILSIIIASNFSLYLVPLVSKSIPNKDFAEYASFIGMFLISYIIFSIVKFFIIKSLEFFNKGAVDRMLGAGFGLIRGVIFSCIIYISIISVTSALIIKEKQWPYHLSINKDHLPSWVASSALDKKLFEMSKTVILMLPESWWRKIETIIIKNSIEDTKNVSLLKTKILENAVKINDKDMVRIALDKFENASPNEKGKLIDDLREFFGKDEVNGQITYNQYREILRLLDKLENGDD